MSATIVPSLIAGQWEEPGSDKVITSRWWLAEKLDHSKPEGRGH